MVSQTIPVLFNRLFCCKEAEHLDTSKASVEEHSWESAPLTQLTFAWRQLLLEQRQPSKWYRHSDNPRASALTKTTQFNSKYCVLSPSHSSAFSKLRGDLNFSDKSHKPVLCHCAHMELSAGRHKTTQPTDRPCWVLPFWQQHLFLQSPTTGPTTVTQKSST